MTEEYVEDPFTSYNKTNTAPTLIGNWVEERVLQDTTGVTRLDDKGTTALDVPTSVYAKREDQAPQAPTFPRVIEHSCNQLHPADWRSTQQISYQGSGGPSQLLQYRNQANMGPREKMMLEQLAREAADLPEEVQYSLTGHPIPATLQSTYKAELPGHATSGMQIGARVMCDRDMRPAKRDPTFLAETQIVAKHLADRVFGETAKQAGATLTTRLMNPDVPITIYSEAVATKAYGGTFQGTQTISHTAPFAKSVNFSKPINDYSKVVIDE